jgi:hypothetical protein
MPDRSSLPSLLTFQLSQSENELLQQQFECFLPDANLVTRSKSDIERSLTSAADIPGVYFWLMRDGSNYYKIYVGKTKSLKRRVSDYLKGFQPHSPNDYKIRIFQEVVLNHIPTAGFILYFARASVETYTQLETEMVQRYAPLLNRRARLCGDAREVFQKAFEVYYRQGFEELLNAES